MQQPRTRTCAARQVISVDPPATVELHVASTSPGVKGNTVSGA